MNAPVDVSLDVARAWISQSLVYERILTRCIFSSCGKYLLAAGQHEDVQRWDLATGKRTALVGHRSWVDALAVSTSDKQPTLFSGDLHGELRAWSYQDARPTSAWKRPNAHRGWIRAVAATPDGNLLSAGNDRVVRLWDGRDGKLIREHSGHENYVFSLAFHPRESVFVSGDLNGRVVAWDYASGKKLRTFDAKQLHTRKSNFLADVGGVRSLAFDRDGKWLACGGMTDAKSNSFCPGKPAILLFDWKTGKIRQTLRPQHTSDGPIKGLAFLADGTIAGHAEHLNGASSLEFWKPDAPKSIHVIKRQSAYCLDLHPDGKRLAAATFKPHGRIGNGRHASPAEYTSHNGEIAVFSLFAQPEKKKK